MRKGQLLAVVLTGLLQLVEHWDNASIDNQLQRLLGTVQGRVDQVVAALQSRIAIIGVANGRVDDRVLGQLVDNGKVGQRADGRGLGVGGHRERRVLIWVKWLGEECTQEKGRKCQEEEKHKGNKSGREDSQSVGDKGRRGNDRPRWLMLGAL